MKIKKTDIALIAAVTNNSTSWCFFLNKPISIDEPINYQFNYLKEKFAIDMVKITTILILNIKKSNKKLM